MRSSGLDVEAVAGLDLDRAHAFGEQRVEARQRSGESVVLVGRAHGAHRRDDAAAGAGDILVAGSAETHLELARAVAGEDEVGVAVDEGGEDPAAAAVDRGKAAEGGGEGCLRARPGDPAVGDREGALLDDAEISASQGRQVGVAPEAGGHQLTLHYVCTYLHYTCPKSIQTR